MNIFLNKLPFYSKIKIIFAPEMKDKNEIRAKIISAAESLFERYGYEKTTMEDIAGKVNLGKTAMYYYYKSKSQIFSEVLDSEFSGMRSQLEAIRSKQFPNQLSQLREYLKTRMYLMRKTAVYRHYLLESFLQRGGEISDILQDARDRFDLWEKEYFSDVCKKGHESNFLSDKVKPETFGEMLIMLLKGLEAQFSTTCDPESSRSTYEEVLDRMLTGCMAQTAKI